MKGVVLMHFQYILVGGRIIPNEHPNVGPMQIDLGVLLAFITGANMIPPAGFAQQPTNDFDYRESSLPSASTFAPTLHLPIGLSDPDEFKQTLDFTLCNCYGFGLPQLHCDFCLLCLYITC